MCGIAGFISNSRWSEEPDAAWMDAVIEHMERYLTDNGDPASLARILEALADRHDDLMSFGMHLELVEERVLLGRVRKLIGQLYTALQRSEHSIPESGPTDLL